MAVATPLEASATRPLRPSALGVLLLGTALAPIDLSIVNVALPTIGTDLGASTSVLEGVVAGYGIALAVFLVLGGRLGDRFGRRRIFMLGLAGFTLASLICGLAPSAGWLVGARVLQGATAALLFPQALAIVQATTSGAARVRAISAYGAVGSGSMIIGQLVGGLLVAADIAGTGWRPIFLVNVPIGLVALALARPMIPETRAADPHGVDRAGTLLLALALLCLMVPVMEGQALGWPAWTIAMLVAFPFVVAAFVGVERRAEARGIVPLLPPSMVAVPSMRLGLSMVGPYFVAVGGFLFVVSLLLQEGARLGPLGAGLTMSSFALAFGVSAVMAGRLVPRFGNRVISVGAGVQLSGLLLLVVTVLASWPHPDPVELVPGLVVIGLGQGLAAVTMFGVVLSGVPAELAGAGSGTLSTVQQGAVALGTAVLGTLFASLAARLGPAGAFAAVATVQAVVLAATCAAATRLPARPAAPA